MTCMKLNLHQNWKTVVLSLHLWYKWGVPNSHDYFLIFVKCIRSERREV